MKAILNNDFSGISPEIIKRSLIEYYSKRTPKLIRNIKTYEKETISSQQPIVIQEPKIIIEEKKRSVQDACVQTDNSREKYDYIFRIHDKRTRRSTAWKLYKDMCDRCCVDPVLKYPEGDDRDYIKLLIKLEEENI